MDNNNLHIVNTHGNGRHSESSPDLTSSSVLDNNHNALNLNKTDESVSSSSSVEPRSESSLTDPIRSINKDNDNYGNFYEDDVANDNIEADRESVLSDFISSHMVPLPHISTDPASDEDDDEEDFISVTSSREANWEDNWLFKKKKSSKTSASVGMLVPAPKEDIRALIGDKPTDEVSDLSEIGSDTDDSSLEMVSASLEPLNDRLVNKHLIGGKNTKIVLDEMADRTSMISTSSLPDNVPPYTETKNEFVVSNDGLNESQPLKISVNNCNKAISNEAINSNVTKVIPPKAEKLAKEGQVTEDESIVPPPNDFTDDEKMRNLLAKFNEEQSNKTDSGDDNSSSLSPRSSISCALSAGIDRAELDAYEGITDFCVEDEEGMASEIDPAESSSRRPSVIEILAAIALGPMLAVSASDDRNILTELELGSLMELNELAMAQLNAKANEERRLGVIAEESFDSGPGDDHKIETIEGNEEADLLSSPKMVMDAIRELVGKDAIKSESSVIIEEITEEPIETEEPREDVIEETFEIVSGEEEKVKTETTTQCEEEAREENQKDQCEMKSKLETQTTEESKTSENASDEGQINDIKSVGCSNSNDEENGNTVDSFSDDVGFEKVIPDDTSSISDESLHTIGSSPEYSDDLEGDTTSYFVDEHTSTGEAEISEDQKIQQSKEETAETQSTKQSDKATNEFILPPPTEFCDEQSKKINEDGKTVQVTEAHINYETVQAETQKTFENSNNELENTVTEGETHNEKPLTDIKNEPEEVKEDTEVALTFETAEISSLKEVLTQSEKSEEPPDKQSINETSLNNDVEPSLELVSATETSQNIPESTKANNKSSDGSLNADESNKEEEIKPSEDSAEKVPSEQVSKEIIEEQTASIDLNEPPALKILSEAQLTSQKVSCDKSTKEELPTPNFVEEQVNTLNCPRESEISCETFKLEDSNTIDDAILNASRPEDSSNDTLSEGKSSKLPVDTISDIKILKEEIVENVDEIKENQVTSKQQELEEPTIENPVEKLATESTTTENVVAMEDDTVQSKLEDNPIAEKLSSENKCEPNEEIKTENIEEVVENKDVNNIPDDKVVSVVAEILNTSQDEKVTKSEDGPVSTDTFQANESLAEVNFSSENLTTEVSSDLQVTEKQNKDSSESENTEQKPQLEETTAETLPEQKIDTEDQIKSIEDAYINESDSTTPAISDDGTASEKNSKDLQAEVVTLEEVTEVSSKELNTAKLDTEPNTESLKDGVKIETIPFENKVGALNTDVVVEANLVSEKLTEELSKTSLEVPSDNEVITGSPLVQQNIEIEVEVEQKTVESINVNEIKEKSDQTLPETDEVTLVSSNPSDQAQSEEIFPPISDPILVEECSKEQKGTEAEHEEVTKISDSETLLSEQLIKTVNAEPLILDNCDGEKMENKEVVDNENKVEALNTDVVVEKNLVSEKLTEELSKQSLEEPSDIEVIAGTPLGQQNIKMEVEQEQEQEQETVESINVNEIKEKSDQTLINTDDLYLVSSEPSDQAQIEEISPAISDPILKEECSKEQEGTEAEVEDVTKIIDSETLPSEQLIKTADTDPLILDNCDGEKAEIKEEVDSEKNKTDVETQLAMVAISSEEQSEINNEQNTEAEKIENPNQVAQNETEAVEESSEEKTTEGQTLLSNENDTISVTDNTIGLASNEEADCFKVESSNELLTEVLDITEVPEIENVQGELLNDVTKKVEEVLESPAIPAELLVVEVLISKEEEIKCEEAENVPQTQENDILDESVTAEKLGEIPNLQSALETSETTAEIHMECASAQNESKEINQETSNQRDDKNDDNQSEELKEKTVDEPSTVEGFEEEQPQNKQISGSNTLKNKTDDDKKVENEKLKVTEVDIAIKNEIDIKKESNEENLVILSQENTSVEESVEFLNTSILIEKNLDTLLQEEQTTEQAIKLSTESSITKESALVDDSTINTLQEITSPSKESTASVAKTCTNSEEKPQDDSDNIKEEQQNEISETQKVEEKQTQAIATEEISKGTTVFKEEQQSELPALPKLEEEQVEVLATEELSIECQSKTENNIECESINSENITEPSEKSSESINSEKVQDGDLTIQEEIQKVDDIEQIDEQTKETAGSQSIKPVSNEEQIESTVVESAEQDEFQVNKEVSADTLETIPRHCEQNLTEQNVEAAEIENAVIQTVTNDESSNIKQDGREQTESSSTEEVQVEITKATSEEETVSNENNTCEASKPCKESVNQSNDQNQTETLTSDSILSVVDAQADKKAENIVDNHRNEKSVMVSENETLSTDDVDKTSAFGSAEVEEKVIEESCNSTQQEIGTANSNQPMHLATQPDEILEGLISQIDEAKIEEIIEPSTINVVQNEPIVETQKSDPETKEEITEDQPKQSRPSEGNVETTETTEGTTETVKTAEQEPSEKLTSGEPNNAEQCKTQITEQIETEEEHQTIIIESEQKEKAPETETEDLKYNDQKLMLEELNSKDQGNQRAQSIEPEETNLAEEITAENIEKTEINPENQQEPSLLTEIISEQVTEPEIENSSSPCVQIQFINDEIPVDENNKVQEEPDVIENISNDLKSSTKNETILLEETISTKEQSKEVELAEPLAVKELVEESTSKGPAAGSNEQESTAELLAQEEKLIDSEKVSEEDIFNEPITNFEESSEPTKISEEIKEITSEETHEEATSLISTIDSNEASLPTETLAKSDEKVSESTPSPEHTDDKPQKDDSINKTVPVEVKSDLQKSEEPISEATNKVPSEEACIVEENPKSEEPISEATNKVPSEEACIVEESSEEGILENLAVKPDTANVEGAPMPEAEVQNAEKEVELETQEAALDGNGLTLKTDDEKLKSILNENNSTLKTDDEKIEEISVVKDTLTENLIEESIIQEQKPEIIPSESLNTQECVVDNETSPVPLEEHLGETESCAIQKEVNSELETTIFNESESQKSTENIQDTTDQVKSADSANIPSNAEIQATNVNESLTTDSEKINESKTVEDSPSLTSSDDMTASSEAVSTENIIVTEIAQAEEGTEASKSEESPSISEVTQISLDTIQTEPTVEVKAVLDVTSDIPNDDVKSTDVPAPTKRSLEQKPIADEEEITSEKVDVLQSPEVSELSQTDNLPSLTNQNGNQSETAVENVPEKLAESSILQEDSDNKPIPLDGLQVKEPCETAISSADQIDEVGSSLHSSSCLEIIPKEDTDISKEEVTIHQPIATREPITQEISEDLEKVISDETTKVNEETLNKNDELPKPEESINDSLVINTEEVNKSLPVCSDASILQEKESTLVEEQDSQFNDLQEVSVPKEQIEDNSVAPAFEVTIELKSLEVKSSEDIAVVEKEIPKTEISEESNIEEVDTNIEAPVEIVETINDKTVTDGTTSDDKIIGSLNIEQVSIHSKAETLVQDVEVTAETSIVKTEILMELNELPTSGESSSDLKETLVQTEADSVTAEQETNIGSTEEEKIVEIVLSKETENTCIPADNQIKASSGEDNQKEEKPIQQTEVEAADVKENISEKIVEAQVVQEQRTEVKYEPVETKIEKKVEAAGNLTNASETDKLTESEPIPSEENETRNASNVEVIPPEQINVIEEPIFGTKNIKEEVSGIETASGSPVVPEEIKTAEKINDESSANQSNSNDFTILASEVETIVFESENETLESEQLNTNSKVALIKTPDTVADNTHLKKDSNVLEFPAVQDNEESDSEDSYLSAAEENSAEDKGSIENTPSQKQTESTTEESVSENVETAVDEISNEVANEASEVTHKEVEITKDPTLIPQKPDEPEEQSKTSELSTNSTKEVDIQLENVETAVDGIPIEVVNEAPEVSHKEEELTKDQTLIPQKSDEPEEQSKTTKEVDIQLENVDKSSNIEAIKTEDIIEPSPDSKDIQTKTEQMQNQELTVTEATSSETTSDQSQAQIPTETEISESVAKTVQDIQNETESNTFDINLESPKSEDIISSDEKDKSIHSEVDTDSKPEEFKQKEDVSTVQEETEAIKADSSVVDELPETSKENPMEQIEPEQVEKIIEESTTQIPISKYKDASLSLEEKQTNIDEKKVSIVQEDKEKESASKEELPTKPEETTEEVTENIQTNSDSANKNLPTELIIIQDTSASSLNEDSNSSEIEEVPIKTDTESLSEKVTENNEKTPSQDEKIIPEATKEESCSSDETKINEEIATKSTPPVSILDSKDTPKVAKDALAETASELVAEPATSPEEIQAEGTPELKSALQSEPQIKSGEETLAGQEIVKTATSQEESNKVSAETISAENTIPIQDVEEAQTSSEAISAKLEKVNTSDEDIQIQKPTESSQEETQKRESSSVAIAEDNLSEVITEQVVDVEEIPQVEVLTATCKIITHPPLQQSESLIESAQYIYDKIASPILETTPDIKTPTLAEELRMADDKNDDKESSKSERVIPQSIACENRCFTSDPQLNQPIASDSVAPELPNAQDASQGNPMNQVVKQFIFAEQSARKPKAKTSGSKFRNLTLRDRRFLAELEKRRKQRELIQNYLDSLDCIDTPSYRNEDLYLFESKCSIEQSPYSLFIEPSDYCIVGATSTSPTANSHYLKTNILFSDRISSDSNCTDDSTPTVIDTFGSMETQSNSDSGEEFSPDASTDRESSATATTANNSIITTTNKATNQSHIYSPPQPQPELRTESACSKLINETRTTGGNEEHVDDDPLKHLVPGSIAEREYKKWYNAVDMPNNPYSVEALRRRLSGGHDRAFDLPNISPCNEENPLQLCDSPVAEADNKGQERDYSRYSRDYYINDAKQASGTTKKTPTSPPQISSPTSTTSSIELIDRVESSAQSVETTPVKEMCHKLEKQCRVEADIYLATPVHVIEDIPQAFADKNPIQAAVGTITSLTTEAVSKLSSETSSILTNESLTPSEDSDTIRIYDLKKQETRLIKESTQTTTITVPKSPEKKIRPTELDIMPTLAPPIATVSAKASTPNSFKFLQPKRKLISPSQVLSIDLDTTPVTPATPEKPVIEAEVAHAMPSVKALAKAFLLTTSTSTSENKWRKVSVLNRLQGPEAGISDSFVKARAKSPLQFFKVTTAASAAANKSTVIQKLPEPVVPDTTSQGSEDATIASDLSSLETDPPSKIDGDTLDASEDRAPSPVVLSGCLRNNIAFFENLKNK